MAELHTSDVKSPPPLPPLPKGGSYGVIPLTRDAAGFSAARNPDANGSNPLRTWFRSTVSALCYSVLYERCGDHGSDGDFPHNRTVAFVLDQHGRMPEYLRLPFAAVTLAFDASSVLRHGRCFHRLPHTARWKQIEAWRSAALAPCRDLIRFYESFVIFHWHSVQLERAGVESVGASEAH